jgi:hypothetical protein
MKCPYLTSGKTLIAALKNLNICSIKLKAASRGYHLTRRQDLPKVRQNIRKTSKSQVPGRLMDQFIGIIGRTDRIVNNSTSSSIYQLGD